MRLWIRRFLLLLLFLGVGAVIFWLFQPRPIGVDLALVTRGAMRVTVDEDGETRIKERYEISSPLQGRMTRIELKAGDAVEAGRTLLTMIEPTDPMLLDARSRTEAEKRIREAESMRQVALSNVKSAESRLAQTRADLNRARAAPIALSVQEAENLVTRERLAGEELRSLQLTAQAAEYRLELAQAALVRMRPSSSGDPDPERLELRSPIKGKILRVHQESAAVVMMGQKILEIGDPTDLECWIDVLSADAVKIRPGAKAFLEHWGGAEPLLGRVRRVHPSGFKKISALGVEEQRVWVILDLAAPPEARPTLGDAFRVEARIVIWEAEDVLKVPSSALLPRGEGKAVFLRSGEVAQLRLVKIGHNNGLEAEVLEGLQVGDEVVVHPSDRIQEGVGIIPR